jgi:cyclopropane fatty-acyl-phospholipid synthase-like methyltransferase
MQLIKEEWQNKESLVCPSCGSNQYALLENYWSDDFNASFDILECKVCQTKRPYPFLTDAQLDEYYSKEVITAGASYERQKKGLRYIFNWLGTYTTSLTGKKVLDIGSNSGGLLRYFKEKAGCEVLGIELSSICKEYSENINKVPVFQGHVADYISKNPHKKFDLVLIVHTFEHIPNPLQFLEDMQKLVADNGYVYIELPNSNMKDYELAKPENPLRIPFHSYLYTVDSLNQILEKSGFTIVKNRYWSRHQDRDPLSKAWVYHLRSKQKKKNTLISAALFKVAKGIIRFYPNRYLIGYYYKTKNQASTIAVLAQKKA